MQAAHINLFSMVFFRMVSYILFCMDKKPSKLEVERAETELAAEAFNAGNHIKKDPSYSAVSQNKTIRDVLYWYLVDDLTGGSAYLDDSRYPNLNDVVHILGRDTRTHIEMERLEWTVAVCKEETGGCMNEQCEAYGIEDGNYGNAECYILSDENFRTKDGRDELDTYINLAMEDFNAYDLEKLRARVDFVESTK